MGFRGDILAYLFNHGPSPGNVGRRDNILAATQWDHYDAPTDLGGIPIDYSPHWSDLRNGEYLRLDYATSRDTRFRNHHKVIIWFY